MAFLAQDIEILLNGAMQNYIFKFAFESRNPGCEFDLEKWIQDLNNFNFNDLMIMSPEKELQMGKILNDLDKYAKKKSKLELI